MGTSLFDNHPILSTAEMRASESAAMVSGAVTGRQLMERAGSAVAGHIRLRWPKPGQATVLCGPGNNGGDGYVVARRLDQAGWRVTVLGMDNRPGPDAAQMKWQWQQIGPIRAIEDGLPDQPGDLVVDALFGTGLTRPPGGAIARLLHQLRQRRDFCVVAVDCPSGLCMDSGRVLTGPEGEALAPAARLTVAFDSLKPGHLLSQGPMLCGELVITDIGIGPWRSPASAHRATLHPGLAPALSKDPAGHKYAAGHAAVIAGDLGAGGAARLAARAALRIGAGLVTICATRAGLVEHAGPPDALMRRATDRPDDLQAMLADPRLTALCIGPGCGIERARDLLGPILAWRGRAVLDADALTVMAQDAALMARLHGNCVLTPHAGEFGRLFPDLADRLRAPATHGPAYSRLDAARQAASRSGAVVLLKGPDTVIAAPDGEAVIHSAHDTPWLATAGAGDVLAGLIAGLLARGQNPLMGAGLAATLHSAAARHHGPGLIADDLPEALPAILSDPRLRAQSR